MPDQPAVATDPAPEADVNAGAAAGFIERRRAAAVAALDAMPAATGRGSPAPVAAVAAATPQLPVAAGAPQPGGGDPIKPDDDPGMAALRKQEVHLRRQISEERNTWIAERDRESAAMKAQREEIAQHKARMAAAKDDPIAYLQAAGFNEGDFDPLSRLIWAKSAEGAKDPRNMTAAVQTKAQREQSTALEKMQARLDEFEGAAKKREAETRAQSQLQSYLGEVSKAVSDETPIARAALAKSPDRAHQRMLQIADQLYAQSGPSDDLRDVPTPASVLKAYEAERRADYAELEAIMRSAAQPAPAGTGAAPAVNGQRSVTLAPGGAAPTQIQRPGRKSRDELIADVERIAAQRQQ